MGPIFLFQKIWDKVYGWWQAKRVKNADHRNILHFIDIVRLVKPTYNAGT